MTRTGTGAGDLLSEALAASLQSTTRMIAERLDVELIDIDVTVSADVDVRDSFMVDTAASAGFRRMRCEIRVEVPLGVEGHALKALMNDAERSCVVLHTLARRIEVHTAWQIDQELTDRNVPEPD